MPASMLVRNTTMMLACVLLGACSSAPKESFYTLNPSAGATIPPMTTQQSAGTTSTTSTGAAIVSIAVGPVRVPDIVDRPQLVVRRGPTQVDLLEQHRWSQPLRAEIAQAIASGLRSHLPGTRIALDRDAAAQNAQIRVAVDISRFDAVPGEAVMVQALWSLRANTTQPPLAGQSAAREPLQGNGNDEIAHAFARAVASISRDIAMAIAAMPGQAAAK